MGPQRKRYGMDCPTCGTRFEVPPEKLIYADDGRAADGVGSAECPKGHTFAVEIGMLRELRE